MSITTPEKQPPSKTTPKKKTPKKDRTPAKMRTPKARSLQLDEESRPKVKFSPKVMLFEGKMSLAESKAGLPDSPLATTVGKKSNLKRAIASVPDRSVKKTLDMEPMDVDNKVVKLKEKIKKKRELMKALPNRKGLGHVDPKTKRVIKKNVGGNAAASTPGATEGAAASPTRKAANAKKKKAKDGGGKVAKVSVGGKAAKVAVGGKAAKVAVGGKAVKVTVGGKAAKVAVGGKAAKVAVGGKAAKVAVGGKAAKVAVGGPRKAAAAGAKSNDVENAARDVVLKVKKTFASAPVAAPSPNKKGEKRKRDAGDDDGQVGAEKKVVVVDGGGESPKSRPKVATTAATPAAATKKAAKKPAAALSAKVYKQFHGKNTLSENKQKLANMKKKERKTFRQQQKLGDNWSQLKEIKVIWESLRRASLDAEKRKALCEVLCAKIKGNVKTLCFMHDISRALQCLMKHATTEQRDAIFDEIKGDLVEMAKNKYAKNFIKRIMDKGTKEQREIIIASFASHVPELAKHADASKVLEYSVSNFSNASQRMAMVEEFYGPSYSFHKTADHQSLDDLFNAKPEARNSILDFMKAKVLSHTEKESFTTLVVQKATLEFLRLSGTFEKPEMRQEVIEHVREALVHVLHTHEGARIALQALWHGTAKDRKAILKSFKGHVVKIAMDEHGYQVLLGAIDVTDDTKMMSKSLIEELAASSESLTSIMESKHGRTVVFYLIHHRDPRHVHPDLLAILKAGDGNATSKKDPEIRRRELGAASLPHLLRHLANHVPALIKTKTGAVAIYTILEAAKDDNMVEAKEAFNAVIEMVAAPFDDAATSGDDASFHPVADAGGHLCVKKIIQQNSSFAPRLLERVTDDQLRSWASCNRGCYVLLALVEHEDENVGKRLIEALGSIKASLDASDFSGAKLLTAKL